MCRVLIRVRFTGIAWATSSNPDVIHTVTSWTSRLNHNGDKEKAPTTISYQEGEVCGWGYDNLPSDATLRWFKLLLLDDRDLPEHLRDSQQLDHAKRLVAISKKTLIEVIADYLRCIWEHTLVAITKAKGPNTVEVSKFQVVVTLPAIWPVYAQSRMREAIDLAGITKARAVGETSLSFISEPEAAALATMKDLSRESGVQENDHFVVCDAGGGTVVCFPVSIFFCSDLKLFRISSRTRSWRETL